MKQLVPALFAVGAIMALTGAAVYITFVCQTAEETVLVQKTNDNSKCYDGDKILTPAYETPDSDQFIHNFSFLYPQR